ncbi:SDR family NAD(P)-dependent oxidoreductase [Candidatus Accumulibacter phosphatis]|uniref:SDR family NAD(P)-dependent oxidoreductase n=1 Tax=Candidatus Accumulibacter phosphatis TaxID=327160 RepID=A0ABX1TW12_9PROT|nr:SDR family NAD(P)-dependent oxidoreductase [Candidatus Accumulibacter phosphatis]NMQ27264.1 SDR family NAD(P)-dependent oxidoreductase [Candidatus Accumulibacter phosphatis]
MHLEDLKGDWALVTGASSGIGQEFALQLAAAGVNLVLVARRADRLKSLATNLRARHGIEALDLPIDLAQAMAAEELHQLLQRQGIKIRLLVNNAALGHWAPFETGTTQAYEALIRVNALAVVNLCHNFLHDLASHHDSAIINVSSPAAYQPVPFLAVYAASKAFVHNFSQALHEEWRKHGVLVQTLLPGPTPTELPGAQAGTRGKGIGTTVGASYPVRLSLPHLAKATAVVTAARGTLWQRLFALLPAKFVIRQVSRMFSPGS